MIRHFVLVRFRSDVSQETKASLFAALDGLRRHVAGVIDFHAGPNVSVETPLVRGFLDAFWFDFENVAARDAYLIDPQHQSVGARIVAETEGGADGIIVVDMEV